MVSLMAKYVVIKNNDKNLGMCENVAAQNQNIDFTNAVYTLNAAFTKRGTLA